MCVSQLRKAIGAGAETGQVLITRSPGYLLELTPEQLDVARFERLARDGRAQRLESGGVEQAAEKRTNCRRAASSAGPTLTTCASIWRWPYEPG